MEKQNKKVKYIVIAVISIMIITIGISYALWVMISEQKEINMLSTSCLNVTMGPFQRMKYGNET